MHQASIVVVDSMMFEALSRLRLAPIDRGLVARKLGLARDASTKRPARPVYSFANVVPTALTATPIASAALATLSTRRSVRLAVTILVRKTMLSARCKRVRIIPMWIMHDDGTWDPLVANLASTARFMVGVHCGRIFVPDALTAPPYALPALTACVDAL